MANSLPTIKTLDKSPFKNVCFGVGNLPTTFVDSLSYWEALAKIIDCIENQLIPAINVDTEEINKLKIDFADLREFVEESIKDIPKLREEFEELSQKVDDKLVELQEQYEAFVQSVDATITSRINEFRISIMNLLNGEIALVNARIDNVIEDYNYKIANIDLSNIRVFNASRGEYQTLQQVLDDLFELRRTDSISAIEYDQLDLTASVYDAKQISAYNYDNYGKSLLIG